MAANEAGGVAAATGTVTHFPSQPPKDLRLSRGDLTVLLPDRPATNTGMRYRLPDLVAMRKCDGPGFGIYGTGSQQTTANTTGVVGGSCVLAV